jgi:hypothetical protein
MTPRFGITALFKGVCLYICVGRLWALSSWHYDILVSILSWANALTLLLTHLLAFDCDSWVRLSDSSALIIALHLEALEGLFAMGFLVTLGFCRQLDGLEQWWRFGMCWWLFVAGSSDWFVRGSCGSPVEHRIPTLVDCSCRNFLAFDMFLWRLLRGSVCDTD